MYQLLDQQREIYEKVVDENALYNLCSFALFSKTYHKLDLNVFFVQKFHWFSFTTIVKKDYFFTIEITRLMICEGFKKSEIIDGF